MQGQLSLPLDPPKSTSELVELAVVLGARSVAGWSPDEEELLVLAGDFRSGAIVADALVESTRAEIRRGLDPLGHAFCALHSPETRRSQGATYTPKPLVDAMTTWATGRVTPVRIVDPGVGSGRFLVAAGRAFPNAELIGSEINPEAAILARAHLAVAGFADRSQIQLGDFRSLSLPEVSGQTLFIGNPPYVRHHLIGSEWKEWLSRTAGQYGLKASKLAGLHVHFFLATAGLARPGDVGVFVTSAEWLDVNYGRLVRDLLLRDLGLQSLHLVAPTSETFEDAMTTAVVTPFEVGSKPLKIGVRQVERVADLGSLNDGPQFHRARLESARRWSPLMRTAREVPEGFVELGELCRVHRGQVTGANKVWIAGAHSNGLPDTVLFPSITRARELFNAGRVLDETDHLRRVIDLPEDLDTLPPEGKQSVQRFLRHARRVGAHEAYTARHRRAWWSVGLREPAPILATYMARRPPAFVRNEGGAHHINIAHGLYPRDPMSDATLVALADYLRASTTTGQGRTYAGGLTKFEPKEMERLMVPMPEVLNDSDALSSFLDA